MLPLKLRKLLDIWRLRVLSDARDGKFYGEVLDQNWPILPEQIGHWWKLESAHLEIFCEILLIDSGGVLELWQNHFGAESSFGDGACGVMIFGFLGTQNVFGSFSGLSMRGPEEAFC